jgi:hypothetical protein
VLRSLLLDSLRLLRMDEKYLTPWDFVTSCYFMFHLSPDGEFVNRPLPIDDDEAHSGNWQKGDRRT